MCVCVCVGPPTTCPPTCLGMRLSVCKSVYLQERLGRPERRGRREKERGRAVEGFRGKCGHQLLAADPGRRLLDGNPAADV